MDYKNGSQKFVEIYGNYDLEELLKKGFFPVGKPALLVGNPRDVENEQLRKSIEITNPGKEYDAIAIYWKSNPNLLPKDGGHTQIIGNIQPVNLLVVQALKKYTKS